MRRKLSLGRWSRPAFRVLRAMRRLRGTPFDPFGHTKVRRVERALPAEYRNLVEKALVDLSPATHERAVRLAELPDLIRGYEQIKLANVDRYHEQVRALGF
jgi:indolepyruvate ferredoxin oxidoreductase